MKTTKTTTEQLINELNLLPVMAESSERLKYLDTRRLEALKQIAEIDETIANLQIANLKIDATQNFIESGEIDTAQVIGAINENATKKNLLEQAIAEIKSQQRFEQSAVAQKAVKQFGLDGLAARGRSELIEALSTCLDALHQSLKIADCIERHGPTATGSLSAGFSVDLSEAIHRHLEQLVSAAAQEGANRISNAGSLSVYEWFTTRLKKLDTSLLSKA